MTETPYTPIFELTRGSTVESIHYGAVAVADASGRLVAWHGDPQVYTFLRSSAKPFQALPFIEREGHVRYQLTQKEVALICASHSGTDDHAATVSSIQAKTGVSEDELLCGVHPLSHLPTIDAMLSRGEKLTSNRHNCSGKHTGMLAFLRLKVEMGELEAEKAKSVPYTDPGHPIQADILKAFAEMCGLSQNEVSVGIDGCSAPNFAVPLRSAAWAFARLFDPGGLDERRARACKTIREAMTAYPEMVGGPDSFDTHLMKATGGRILCKGGAEGYQALGLPAGAMGPGSPAVGIVLKISDGDLTGHSRPRGDPHGHARPAVTLEVLRQLGAISEKELDELREYGPVFQVHNWRRIEVGEARPSFKLQFGQRI